ncbi:MAG: precorrin-2 dehydrogenase [Actinomycetota bacterium]|nr:precorrin-2 dehydrogenase [Actinomycetota bacterium]
MPDAADNRLYLVALDLADERALVVGGDEMAAEKVAGLRAAGAVVRLVAPVLCKEVRDLVDDGVEWISRTYRAEDLDGCLLVVATTGDDPVSESVATDARARNMLVNVADVPRLCNFILPAITREGPVAVAVSTAGASPALAQRMRREIAESFGPVYAQLAVELRALRAWAKESLPTYERRKAFFDSVVNGSPDPIELLRSGERDGLRSAIEAAKEAAVKQS